MTTPAITVANSRGWPRRVPAAAIGWGIPLSVLIEVAFFPSVGDDYPSTVAAAISWYEFLGNSIFAVVLVSTLMAWRAPRLCVWAFPLSTILYALPAPTDRYAAVLGLFWLGVAVLDATLLGRQRTLSAAWDSPVGSRPPIVLRSLADGWRLPKTSASVLVLIAIVGFGLYVHERQALRDLVHRAVPGQATVVDRDTSVDIVDMKVKGKTYDFFVDDASAYPIGSTQPVFIDPTGKRRPYAIDDIDPDSRLDISILPSAALILAGVITLAPQSRRRRISRLAADGGDPARATVWSGPDSAGLLVAPIDETRTNKPIALIPRPFATAPPDPDEAILEDVREADASIPEPGGPPVAGPAWPHGTPTGPDGPPDLGDIWMLMHPRDLSQFASPTPVILHGFHADGSMVLIEHVDPNGRSRYWAASGAVRDPYTVRRLWRRMRRRRPQTRGTHRRV